MTTLFRSLLAVSALSAAITASAAPTSHHFSLGLQASAGSVYGDHSSSLLSITTGQDNEQENYRSSTAPLVGLYGLNVGYHWGSGIDSWATTLSANFASGHDSHTSITDDELRGEDDSAVISEKLKYKQQYNLMLEWHHQLSTQFDFVAGAGISALKVNAALSVDESVNNGHYTEIRLSQNKVLLGPAVSAGVDYATSSSNHLSVMASYTTYHSTHFNDTADFNTGASEWCVINRRAKLNLFALTVGYSHQF